MNDGLPLPQRRMAYTVLGTTVAMAVLDGSIANTALPVLAHDLHASPADSVWVVNAFQLAGAMTLLSFAALGDALGASRVYRFGIAAFTLGSLLCALAPTLEWLVVMRIVQGVGASAIMALGPALLREIFPRAQLGRGLGLNSLVVASSGAAGPTVGGILLAIAPWPWLFLINVPLGVLSLAAANALPQTRGAGHRIDRTSVALSALAFGALISGFDGVARHEALAFVVVQILAGIAAGWWFVVRQRGLVRPMIAIDLFTNTTFSLAAATSFATFAALGLTWVALPFLFEAVLGYSPFQAGLLLSAWPLSVAIVAPLAGRLSDRYPASVLVTAGLAVYTLGLALYARLPAHPAVVELVLHGAICGIGFGFFQSPNNREFLGSVPREKMGSASGILAAVRVSSTTIGTAVVAILFAAFGASLVHGGPALSVASAIPVTLWLACGCAALATLASAARLFRKAAPTTLRA